jgi:hypothetical protein
MSYNFEDEDSDEFEDFEEEDDPYENANIRQLREQAKAADAAEARVAALRREVAFLKAGIDTDSKAGAYLLKGYEGSMDDLARVASEYGIALRPPTTPRS